MHLARVYPPGHYMINTCFKFGSKIIVVVLFSMVGLTLPKRTAYRGRTSPGERCMSQAAKLEGQRHLSPLTSDGEVRDLVFALLSSDCSHLEG